MRRETILISKLRILSWAEKLKDQPNNVSLCPACENIFAPQYEACDCVRFKP
jgi:hypothetical protein